MSDRSPHILVVDGDANFRQSICLELKKNGLRVSLASCGKRAFEFFPTMPFDLIFANVQMSPGTGLEMISQLKSTGVTVPVVLISDHPGGDGSSYRGSGAMDLLAKPIRCTQMLEKMREARGMRSEFSYFLNVRPSLVVTSWVGELRARDSEYLKSCINETLRSRPRFVILNLHGLMGYDPILASEIVVFQEKAREQGARLLICGLLPSLSEQLSRNGLIEDREVLPTLNDALQQVIHLGLKPKGRQE